MHYFMAVEYLILCTIQNSLNHSPIIIYLGCFQFFSIISDVITNIL